ncbi:uncharacterized protein BDV17DRAFT_225691 [Aspergillus undulatus]|uniref:uncharacterized protein n=1 Tax=Aspergillus undulatus TaxID=1810928 RepID=UPI003CCDBCAC
MDTSRQSLRGPWVLILALSWHLSPSSSLVSTNITLSLSRSLSAVNFAYCRLRQRSFEEFPGLTGSGFIPTMKESAFEIYQGQLCRRAMLV